MIGQIPSKARFEAMINPIPPLGEPDPASYPTSSPDSGGGGCFIASAVYGVSAPETNVLREFRNQYLLKHPFGQQLINFYYRYSPAISKFLSEHENLAMILGWFLVPVVLLCKLTLCVGIRATVLILISLLAILTMVYWNRKWMISIIKNTMQDNRFVH
jgi:hypothetical protein